MSKRIISLTLLLLSTMVATAQVRLTRQEYIDKYKHIAVDHMERYGIPASITMAQGILESNSGNSTLATKSNNHFGIKCKSSWTGGKVYHDDDAKGECFRAYPSVEQSYADHAEFLDKSPRYDFLFDLSSSDYKGWAHGLKKAGYATASDYAQRLIRIIEDSDLQILDQENGIAKYIALNGGTNSYQTSSQNEWFNEAGGVDPDNFATTINGHKGYNVHRNNKIFFVVAKSGDSIEKIADFFMISPRTLRSYNDLGRKDEIVEGEMVYIARKANRWTKDDAAKHTVQRSETVRSIAQDYAITSKSLRKLNRLRSKQTLKVGQVLLIN
ncbi:MAG: glucosaminidase domain-containing protein [Rikenellaceae bacterium]